MLTARVTENLTIYEAIRGMLIGRYTILRQHKMMLEEITGNKISEEESKDYFFNEIGIGRNLSTAEKFKVLVDLDASLEEALALIKQLSKFSMEEQNDTSIMQFYVALNYAKQNSDFEYKQKNSKNTPWDSRASAHFNQHAFLKECMKKLEPSLPKAYQVLEKITKIEHIKNTTLSRTKRTANITSSVNFAFQNDKLASLYKSNTNLLTKLIFDLNSTTIIKTNKEMFDYIDENEISPEDQCVIFTFIKLKYNILEELFSEAGIADHSKSSIATALATIYSQPRCSIKLINLFEEIKNYCDNMVIPKEEKSRADALYKLKKPLIETKYAKVKSRVNFVLQQIEMAKNADLPDDELKTINNYFKILLTNNKDIIDKIVSVWSNNTDSALLSTRKEVETFFESSIKSLSGFSKSLESTLDVIKVILSFAISEKATESIIPETISDESKVKIQQYRENQAKLITNYKAQVMAEREKKKALKAALASSNSSTFFSSVEPELVVNKTMEILLSELGRKQIELLRDIIRNEKNTKVSYADVELLVKNHLGGTISPPKGGSSHRSVRIGKCYTEVSSNLGTESVATGGISRPHNPGHNNELLTRFSLKSLGIIFTKAGITLEVLAKLEENLHSQIAKIV